MARTGRIRAGRVAISALVVVSFAGLVAVSEPVPVGAAAATVTAVATSEVHACALFDSGAVKCWGGNGLGELGVGDTASRGDAAGELGNSLPAVALGTGRTAVAIAAGGVHTCALLDNGAVKCWGYNNLGQLGLGDTSVRGDAPGEMGDALPPVALGTGRTAVALAAGDRHTCAVLDNGDVKCWGDNSAGELGLGDTAARGDSAGEMGDTLPAVALGAGRTAVAVSAKYFQTCAVLDNGALKCWGNNSSGQLGLGNTAARGDAPGEMGDSLPAIALGTGRTALLVAAAGNHTCAVLDTGAVKCWGNGAFGQLGLGSGGSRGDSPGQMGDALPTVALGTGRTAVAMTTGVNHTCAVLDNGAVKCWGYNSVGELGLGDTANRGDGPGEMGDSLPVVALGTGRTVTGAAGGGRSTCAVLDDATVKCWGTNSNGELGLGDTARRGDGPGEMGDSLPAVDLTEGPPPVAVQTTSLAAGKVAVAYSKTLLATPGTPPYSWTKLSGTLPPGIGLSAAGVISGTPTTAGTYSFVVQVADTAAPATTATKALSINVAAGFGIITSSLPAGSLGTPYSKAVVVAGGTKPYKWKKIGKLPTGLKLAGKTGVIAGTPKKKTGSFTFQIQVTDSKKPKPKLVATKTFTIVVS